MDPVKVDTSSEGGPFSHYEYFEPMVTPILCIYCRLFENIIFVVKCRKADVEALKGSVLRYIFA